VGVILLCATSVFSGSPTLNHIGHKEHRGCTERRIWPSPEPGSCVWEGYREIIGDWLMRGRFPTVYPTGPSEEGSAESEPSFCSSSLTCSPVSSSTIKVT